MAFVKTEVQGAVEIITIDRPKALNALNPEVLADLKAAFEAVDQENVRCIVLTADGRCEPFADRHGECRFHATE